MRCKRVDDLTSPTSPSSESPHVSALISNPYNMQSTDPTSPSLVVVLGCAVITSVACGWDIGNPSGC